LYGKDWLWVTVIEMYAVTRRCVPDARDPISSNGSVQQMHPAIFMKRCGVKRGLCFPGVAALDDRIILCPSEFWNVCILCAGKEVRILFLYDTKECFCGSYEKEEGNTQSD
jgi:hypothetical protein